ncbi:MAG: TlyA family RNA methyltransferase [Thermodesulfobacteriaceae bacterium]|nr:TlyA family RNA methyltransferase [Thermodesulfobacteriaceae bacterium]MCX8041915.1 TlyA family RNA methyltransferase [Thermodesulfobacteriaceae bacterium]MDW8135883.1 TlyA family RNA methyltransferase [Thermodesulfobacterium sp.]
MKVAKKRLDQLLVEKKFCESREKARALILAKKVLISFNGKSFQTAQKPGTLVPENVKIQIQEEIPYVSRGGLKLEEALRVFDLKVKDWVCLDVGASTGGFTHCLLLKGAQRVYALDVGKGQLHYSLRKDPRVISMEGINARYLKEDMFPEKFDLITVDVSFISLKKVLPSLVFLLKEEGYILALIKPQFEVGPKFLKKGVVKDSFLHKKVVDEIWEFAKNLRLNPLGVVQSPLLGPKGNQEFFILLKRNF